MDKIVDDKGLVCGYSVDAGGTMTSVKAADIDLYFNQEDSLVWLHFDHGDAGAREWISACERIPESAKALLLGSDSHMRIEAMGGGLCGIIGDLHHEFATESDRLDVLRLYLDNHCLISVRHRPLAAVEKLRKTIGEGMKDGRPIVLVTNFLQHVTDTLGDLILGLADSVDDVEEGLLDGRAARPGEELGRIRRLAARLRRHMVPQQHALLTLLAKLPNWVADTDAARLRSAIEALGALGHDLELVQERARLLQEQASARLMEATNRNLYILSIVTVFFLPISLISGIFGMNLGGLPWLQAHFGFWYGILLMVVTVAVTFGFLRRGRMV
jgi:zinc transporter